VAYDPEPWHDFATSFAGAAGALLGLAFVAISFNLEAILRDKKCEVPTQRTPRSRSLEGRRSPPLRGGSASHVLTMPSISSR
jgi:hypothetical protein